MRCSLAPKVEDCQHTVFFVVRLIVIELQLKIKSTILPAQPVLTNYHEHRQKTCLGRKLSKKKGWQLTFLRLKSFVCARLFMFYVTDRASFP